MSKIIALDHYTDTILAELENKEGAALFWDDEHIDTIDNKETFDFTMQSKVIEADQFTKQNRVIILGDDGFFREFIITATNVYGRNKVVRSTGSFIELTHQKLIDPTTLSGQTVSTALTWALTGTDWQPGITEYAGIRQLAIENHTNALAVVKQIASIFDLEIRFRVEVSGNKISGRYVDMMKSRGKFRGKEVVLGKNLIGVERNENTSEMATALRCLGPVKEDGTRLTVIVEDSEALKQWGRNGRHIWADYEPETENTDLTISRLTTLGNMELAKRVNPIVQYTAEEAALEHIFGYEHEKAYMGDTVRIKDEKFNPPLFLETRIVQISRSVVDPSKKKYTYGDIIEYRSKALEREIKSIKTLLGKKASVAFVTTPATAIAPSFLNGWVNYGQGYKDVTYRKGIDGKVYIDGATKSGLVGYAVFQFPATGGYRPSSRRYLRGNGTSGLIRIDVDTNGFVYVMPDYGATNALVSLDGLSFWP